MTGQLAKIVQRWPGRGRLNLALAERGYGLPSKLISILVRDLRCSREQIELYFDEVAKEYFLSLGSVDPLWREFRGDIVYRSPVLDDLYAARPAGERRAFPPCLASFFDMSAVPDIGKQMRLEQDIEANRNGGDVQATINYPGDLTRIFAEVCREKGFSTDENRATREFRDYSMQCHIARSQRGWRYDTRLRAALVDSETGISFEFHFSLLDMGFTYYSFHGGNCSFARLGIRAQLDFLDVLGILLA